MTRHPDNRRSGLLARHFAMLTVLVITSLPALPIVAGAEEPFPEFVADYIVRVNGIKVGEATFSLMHKGADEYLYRQRSKSTGVAALLGSDTSVQSSRWRYVDGTIKPLEFRSEREEGDDDDNAHLLFDWKRLRVTNRGAGKHWDIEMPEGTLDSLVMQMAMLLDLRDGKTRLEYPVATRGRIKHYVFEVTGKETIALPFGDYETIRAERKDDKKDKSLVWGAPALDYFPVRFLKQKKAGVKVEILLQKLDLNPRLAQDQAD
ncbi:uncharacterized protein DUF3108 [Thiogranum longum]|uniref:Uncharacterized protein DUF3108 n=1 Tax=Thiogranum longum TaxID=1537524 RepID=A0A4R1HB54_9GAMM|nr:DUF3108 domain-containing protein [Thiogranum longum]TCK17831.1 uncharacterized protein DUF3108 [Thiogranum longum]